MCLTPFWQTGSIQSPLRSATYETLVGLLAVSGMRVGEAIRLDRTDVDLRAGVVVVWVSKFRKSREVPLQVSATTALARYASTRDALLPTPKVEFRTKRPRGQEMARGTTVRSASRRGPRCA